MACRSGATAPMLPRILERGRMARNPKRISDSTTSPVPGKSASPSSNDIVESWNRLPDLRADSTYEEIAIGRKLAQNESRAVFDFTVRLGERREHDITFGHCRTPGWAP